MRGNVIFMGWNRPLTGREAKSGELFQEFTSYLGGLQRDGRITSFQTVLLEPHGGDLNGFFLIEGEAEDLDELQSSEEWFRYVTRAGTHLEGTGVVRGATGELVGKWMEVWQRSMPR